ncbi:hypothetical protein BH09PAT3_BH09PAT3_2860 [soil metagenome]
MKLELSELPTLALTQLKRLGRYRVILFALFVVGLCSYLIFQIGQASSVQPATQDATASTSSTPRIDPLVVKQLQELQDNSVNVQALFNEARTNPFQ